MGAISHGTIEIEDSASQLGYWRQRWRFSRGCFMILKFHMCIWENKRAFNFKFVSWLPTSIIHSPFYTECWHLRSSLPITAAILQNIGPRTIKIITWIELGLRCKLYCSQWSMLLRFWHKMWLPKCSKWFLRKSTGIFPVKLSRSGYRGKLNDIACWLKFCKSLPIFPK